MGIRKIGTRVTIKDVAKRAEVSIGTVSRVINNSANVDGSLKRRVENAINELQFRPNIRAQNFVRNQSPIVSFILSNRGNLNPVHAYILQGAEDYCAEAGYFVLFARHSYSSDVSADQLRTPKLLLGHGLADCVIVAGANSENFLDSLDQMGVRHVVLANNLTSTTSRKAVNQVRYDDQSGFYESTKYLVQLGHREIWFIGDTSQFWFRRRYEAYLRAMEASNLRPHAQTIALSDDPYDDGHASVGLILEQHLPLTAVIGSSDEIAFGAIDALRQFGREVPRDVSVIGFSHQVPHSRSAHLTSVCVDTIEVGRQLAKCAIARIKSDGEDVPEVVVPTFLIKRGTCRPCRPDHQMLL
jgi:DNA-binding LacI/PurR family transcriptional regulator